MQKEKKTLLLDSSPIIRCNKFDIEIMTSKTKKNRPEYFNELIRNALDITEKEYNYYLKIYQLLYKKRLNACITYNAILPEKGGINEKIIALFGVLNNNTNTGCYQKNNYTLYGEKIKQELYYKAIDFFLSAEEIIADPCFFSFNVGCSFLKYLSSDTKIMLLKGNLTNNNLLKNHKVIPVNHSPEEFIENLYFLQ